MGPGWKRYVIPSWRRAGVVLAVMVTLAVGIYFVVSPRLTRNEVRKVSPDWLVGPTPGETVLLKAMAFKGEHPEERVKALQHVAARYPGTSVALSAMLAELATGTVSEPRRKDIYEEVVRARQVDPFDRWMLARRLMDQDEAAGWRLCWQLAESPDWRFSAGGPLQTVVGAMEGAGKGAELDAGLLKLIAHDPDASFAREAAEHLARRRQDLPAELVGVLEPVARDYSDRAVGPAAFTLIREGLVQAKDDQKLMEFSRRMLGKGPVGDLARQTMARRYVSGGRLDAALSLYGGAETPDVTTLPAAQVGRLADQMAQDLKGKETGACAVLTELAARCLQKKAVGVGADLLRQAGERCSKPLKDVPAAGTPSDGERAAFWKAYVVFHGGVRGEGEKEYAAMAMSLQDWYRAQICYDLAELRRDQLRYADACELARRAREALPADAQITALGKECEAALEKDRGQLEEIARLQVVIGAMDVPDVIDESRIQIALVQVERKRPAEAIIEMETVWKKHPQSSHAPAALFQAAQLCMGPLGQQAEARRHMEQLVMQYPAHELSAKAYSLLKTLGE